MGISEVVEKLPALRGALAAARREARAPPARRGRADRLPRLPRPPRPAPRPRPACRSSTTSARRSGPGGRGGPARIARRARRIVTLFPFETEIYRRLGADAVWAGHPARRGRARGPRGRAVRFRPRRAGAWCCFREAATPSSSVTGRRLGEAAERLARRLDLEVVAVRAPGLPDSLYAGAAEPGFPRRHGWPPPAARLGGPRLRRLGNGDPRDRPLRRADGRRLPHVRLLPTRSRGPSSGCPGSRSSTSWRARRSSRSCCRTG